MAGTSALKVKVNGQWTSVPNITINGGGSGGNSKGIIKLTTDTLNGKEFTATHGDTVITKQFSEDGKAEFTVDEEGTWNITCEYMAKSINVIFTNNITLNTEIKDIVPIMTSNTSNGTLTVNNYYYYDDYNIWRAFDGNNSTYYHSNGGNPVITYQHPDNKTSIIKQISVLGNQGNNPAGKVTVEGLNEDGTWDMLLNNAAISTWSKLCTIDIDNTNSYNKYRLTFSQLSTGYAAICTIQLLGYLNYL